MTDRTRRQLLAALGVAGLSGCTLLEPSETPAPTRTATPLTPTPTEQPSQETPTPVENAADADVHVITSLQGESWGEKWEGEIVPGFEQRSDLSVAIDYPAHLSEGARRVSKLVSAGDPPEFYDHVMRSVAELVARGHTRPVDDLVVDLSAANGPLLGEYSTRSGGKVRLVPHGLFLGGVVNYRADVYDELGLSVPETWDELVANAKAIDESDRVDVGGFAVVPDDDSFTTWLYTAGGSYWGWRDESKASIELDFRDDHVRAALEIMQTLAEYSPDPAETSLSSVIGKWAGGDVAHCIWSNAWLAGISYTFESIRPGPPTVSLNTRQAAPPLRDSSLDPPTRGIVAIEGTPIFEGANVEHAETFLRYMYEGPARQADKNNLTMRTLPPYEGVIETDEYASSEIYRAEDGHFLELERHLMDEVYPHYAGERAWTAAAWYAMQPGWADEAPIQEMVQSVLVDGKPIDEAIQRARSRLQSRLEDGRELMSG